MLTPSPFVLRSLLEQYETLRLQHEEAESPETHQRMADVAYTLCVLTGTREVPSALGAARALLPDGGPTRTPARTASRTAAAGE